MTAQMTSKRRSAATAGHVAMLVVAMLVAGGCGASGSDDATSSTSKPKIMVFAAASLTEVFQALDPHQRYQFAASDTLATQLNEGADADVFAAANTKLLDELRARGVVDAPQPFATNHVVLVVPSGSKLHSLEDLMADRAAKFVMAADGVPLGDYTVKVLAALDASHLVARVSSRERDAKAVMAKVTLREADAGFVYSTDAKAAGSGVRVIELPKTDANHAVYGIAVMHDTKHEEAARAFVRLVQSPRGRAALADAGFGTP